jgi:methionine-rich copper-binding protein CopC
MRFPLPLILLVVGILSASAHAFLDHASPRVGSTVSTAPHELMLSFTQNLEPAFSTIQVTGPNGAQIAQGKPRISGNIMREAIKAAGSGAYHVHWHVLSVDTHTTEGSYTFYVGGR